MCRCLAFAAFHVAYCVLALAQLSMTGLWQPCTQLPVGCLLARPDCLAQRCCEQQPHTCPARTLLRQYLA